jgi:tetratricopeptide (TPR) repeat protein
MMDAAGVEWGPALLVLVAAGILGALLARSLRASVAGGTRALPLEARDLAERRDGLLRQLRELEDTAVKRTPAQLAQERHRLELDAARTWRDLDARVVAAPVSSPPAAAPASVAAVATPSALRGFLWGAGSMAALGALLLGVWQVARPRGAGDSVTGELPRASAAPDADESRLRDAVAKNPDDLEARLQLARLYLARQDMMAVFGETQYVLERKPGEPRALGYQALVRVAMGQSDLAVSMLKQALATSPDYFEGYVHLMLVYVRMGRSADAEATADAAGQRFPQQAQMLRELLARMRAEVPPEAAQAADAESDPHAGIAPAQAGASPAAGAGAPPEASAAGASLAVEVDIDPSLRGQLPSGTVLFVIVREAGIAKGPPRAVKRVVASSFPVRVTLGEADSMAGEPLPAEARVEARADSDGNPLTRPASDPSAVQDGVKRGAATVRLVLRR